MKVTLALNRVSRHQSFSDRKERRLYLLPLMKLQRRRENTTRDNKKKVPRKRTDTHVWVIVYSWDQVVNEGLQGPGHQVVVMIKEAGVALLLGLVQVLVVAAGVQLPRERRCLRHVVLQRQRGQTQEQSVRTSYPIDISPQTLMQDGQTKSKIAPRHKHRRRRFCLGNGLDAVNTLPPLLSILSFLGSGLGFFFLMYEWLTEKVEKQTVVETQKERKEEAHESSALQWKTLA